MRLHITLDEEVVRELDRRVGPRRRSSFIAEAVTRALDDEGRWELLETSIGALADSEHAWDEDPAAWVAETRASNERRVG